MKPELSGVTVARKHTNTDQTLIEITEDRTRLILQQAANQLAQRREWTTPFGLFVGLLVALLTATFNDGPFGLEADAVEGIVMASTLLAFVWTLVTGYRAIRTPSKYKVVNETIENLKHRAGTRSRESRARR